MKYVCKKQNFVATGLVFILGFVIIALAAFISMGIFIKSVLELCIMLCCVFLIQISSRHLLSWYEYDIDAEEEILLYNRLSVMSATNKNKKYLLTLKLSQLVEILPYKEKKKLKEYSKRVSKYNFCTDMMPKESYLLVFDHVGQTSVLRIQCSNDFVKELEKRAGV